jgi:phosphoribosylamine--glycine ligase
VWHNLSAITDSVEVVFVAPGNAGTELEDKLINVDIGVQDISALIDFAKRNPAYH